MRLVSHGVAQHAERTALIRTRRSVLPQGHLDHAVQLPHFCHGHFGPAVRSDDGFNIFPKFWDPLGHGSDIVECVRHDLSKQRSQISVLYGEREHLKHGMYFGRSQGGCSVDEEGALDDVMVSTLQVPVKGFFHDPLKHILL